MRNGSIIMLLPLEPESIDPFNTDVEDGWLEKIFAIAKERVPLLKNCSIDKESSVAGLYEMSPDEHLVLGKAPGIGNFYLANGSSGHGVMHSPAIGQLIAEMAAGEKSSIDISVLNPSRFNQGRLIESIPFF
jgi:sarcosine oxidase subunit beta